MLASVEHLAQTFDALPSPDAARTLEEAAALSGPSVAVRYYLGRLIGRNLFRSEDQQVSRALVAFVAKMISRRGASVLTAGRLQRWTVAVPLLRDALDARTCGKRRTKPKRVAAIEVLLKDPSLDGEALARAARTTSRQLARISEIAVLRKLIRVHGN
jgi:hypothetical protein